MKNIQSAILSGGLWTFLTYAISMSIRLASNVVLSRLLSPDLIGIIVILNTIRVGIDLFSDLGIEQNVVRNRSGDTQDFLNTAWTIQIIRGVFLTTVFLAISPFLAELYRVNVLIFVVVAFSPLISSLASTSIFILVKNLEIRKRYTFEIKSEIIGFVVTVVLAWLWRDVWAVVVGMLFAIGARSILSHFLPHPPHSFVLVKEHALEIIRFGKWIMLSSLLMYASGQVDKLYLGKTIPHQAFGIYGLAKTIADLPAVLAGRVCYQILFPVISASKHMGNAAVTETLSPQRWKLILLACVGLSFGIAFSDFAIKLLYDARYQDAGWMLCILLTGAWFATLSSLNEAVLLSEKPLYHGISNCVRLVVMIAALAIGTHYYGIAGAIVGVAISEACRYLAILMGQFQVKFSFARQDFLATALLLALVLLWSVARICLNLGLAWDGIK